MQDFFEGLWSPPSFLLLLKEVVVLMFIKNSCPSFTLSVVTTQTQLCSSTKLKYFARYMLERYLVGYFRF